MSEYRPYGTGPPKTQQEERISLLEAQVSTLADAVRALATSLESIPTKDVSHVDEAARGARMAHEILLARNL
ncbi:hypothetical protein [Streptomyces sp. WMMB 322]|uniref:hypothetical protein n=1 Tax=Streptomyces sp. WMMB 322 TaxID=1286821 RepID=UPI0006E3C0A5|nr:hypothetical protein [Streptomyces sp. WMMB 322]SCK53620.1 hypothetical protein H180DRAFT_04880 [Streptomyces sp. WMMB 322]